MEIHKNSSKYRRQNKELTLIKENEAEKTKERWIRDGLFIKVIEGKLNGKNIKGQRMIEVKEM